MARQRQTETDRDRDRDRDRETEREREREKKPRSGQRTTVIIELLFFLRDPVARSGKRGLM